MTGDPTRVLIDHAEQVSPAAYWELLMNLTRREVKGRYSQSFFGVAWAIAQPLATMAVFTLVFSRLAKLPSMGAPYPLFAFAALVPWFFFMNSVSSGTLSLTTVLPAIIHSATTAPSRSRTCKGCGGAPTPGPGSTSRLSTPPPLGTRRKISASSPIQRKSSSTFDSRC